MNFFLIPCKVIRLTGGGGEAENGLYEGDEPASLI
jgi:hypothetical protein